jgi:hypothetical protein
MLGIRAGDLRKHGVKNMNDRSKNYLPLIVVVALAIAMACAINVRHGYSFTAVMNSFMGFFFCLLAMFKLFDPKAFVQGFAMYDVIAKRFNAYGYVYPFIELGLGLAYLSGLVPLITNAIALCVMTLSAIGVIKSVSAGMNLRCACLGTVLNVPLSTVSIVENLGMGVMAAINMALLSL